jgi:hypothetical protein
MSELEQKIRSMAKDGSLLCTLGGGYIDLNEIAGRIAELERQNAELQEKYDCNTAIMHARTATMNRYAAENAELRQQLAASADKTAATVASKDAVQPVAYIINGRIEQGLSFDKSAAETMADMNCGTVVPLCRCTCKTEAPQPQAASEDSKRLDWLDEVNARTNEKHGTVYGWKFDINHNRAALMDHNWPAKSIRAAIDDARAALAQAGKEGV